MTVDINKFEELRSEVLQEQAQMPPDSLDWSIYQGQLDLLDKVEQSFKKPKEQRAVYPPQAEKRN